MKPVKFSEMNCIFAENQKEYLPLPAYKADNGEVVCCWKLNFWERLLILFSGNLWIHLLTFNKPLQPILPSAKKLIKETNERI